MTQYKHETTIYHGSCNGVGKPFPSTRSASPMSLNYEGIEFLFCMIRWLTDRGPRGAQNVPVFSWVKDAMKSTVDIAASDGSTAM